VLSENKELANNVESFLIFGVDGLGGIEIASKLVDKLGVDSAALLTDDRIRANKPEALIDKLCLFSDAF
jgi:hypothetical protein